MPTFARRLLPFAMLATTLMPRTAYATWSIVLLDRATQRIGVAGASCTEMVYGIMGLLPGKGVLIAQGISNTPSIQLGMRLLDQGVSADSVWRAISDSTLDPQLSIRQYAVATLRGEIVQYTGRETPDYHGERKAIDALVQGNTLPGPEVLDRIMAAIQEARTAGRPLEDVLMAGLQAGADAGGDKRCGAQRATSAFLVVARPGEPVGRPYLSLIVYGVDRGKVNAVDFLHRKLSEWEASGGQKNSRSRMDFRPDTTTLEHRDDFGLADVTAGSAHALAANTLTAVRVDPRRRNHLGHDALVRPLASAHHRRVEVPANGTRRSNVATTPPLLYPDSSPNPHLRAARSHVCHACVAHQTRILSAVRGPGAQPRE